MRDEMKLERARVYGTLARLFRPPDASLLDGLRTSGLSDLREALIRLGVDEGTLEPIEKMQASLAGAELEQLQASYQKTFEASGGSSYPPNETAHTIDTPQHALTTNFELADIAGFYRAFGVEVTPGSERPDHIAAELEFMHLLTVKEFVADQEGESDENAKICRDAQRAFLKDHLGRWSSRLGGHLEEVSDSTFYAAAGRLLGRFIPLDASRLSSAAV
jgi:DMSO reductase family type II enzyme chaperone